jgi:hypothetical protein
MCNDSRILLLKKPMIENCMPHNPSHIHHAQPREPRHSFKRRRFAHRKRFVEIEAQDDADADVGGILNLSKLSLAVSQQQDFFYVHKEEVFGPGYEGLELCACFDDGEACGFDRWGVVGDGQ